MKKKQAYIFQKLLEERDSTIAELTEIIKNNAEYLHHALQQKINYYENILALMPGYVYWLDRNNTYLGCNDNQAKHLELRSRHEIMGKRTHDLTKTVEQSFELDKINIEVMETGKLHAVIEHLGEHVYFSQKVPLRDEQNKVIGLLGISIDITELKKTEAALTLAKERAEAANRVKMEFIANMSHDIRTPLSGVVGLSKLLEDSSLNPEQKQYAQWINESGEQLLSLLNSILEVVSTENDSEQDVRRETLDLRQCIYEIIQLERPTSIIKGLDLRINIEEAVPQLVITDRTKLHRILLNLLGNAIKFTQFGHVVVDVSVVATNNVRVQLRFAVIDTGIGIPENIQNNVFERFYRASPSYKGVYSGHGVGLHIAQTYAELLGGEIKLVSKENIGTKAYFDLSLEVGSYSEQAAQQINALAMDKLSQPLKTPTQNTPQLLLIEDNAIARRMLEAITTQAGYRSISASDAEHALSLAQSIPFDLIITDIGLPGMSGYEFTQNIRKWEALTKKDPMPIVGLTAHALIEAKNECIRSGMNDVLVKPISLSVMHTLVKKFMTTKKQITPTDLFKRCSLGPDLPEYESQLFELNQFPLLDIKRALHNISNEALLREMLELMGKVEIPSDERAIKAAHANNDWDNIERIAHKMKGGAVYCGTMRMEYACQYLERYRKAGHTELLERLFQQLINVLDETKQHLFQ